MEIPQISIVVPVYNVEKYLERCIDSILAQTFTDFELLLINDGSKDSSGLICDKYAEKDSRIRVFHKENEGVSRARNLGISNARGRWLCFIDSDDWVDKEYLHCFGDVFNYPDDIIVIQGMERIDGIQGRTLWQVKYPNKCLGKTDLGNGIAHFRLLHSGFPVLKLFNLCIIKKYRILFDTKISYHEDHLYVFNYLKYVTRIYLSEGVAYKYMYNGGCSSLSSKTHPYLESEYAYQCISAQLNKLLEYFDVKNEVYIRQISHFVYQIRIEGLFFCYLQECRKKRMEYLQKLKDDTEGIQKKYNPESLGGKFLKWILKTFPVFFLDRLLLLYVSVKK